MSETATVTDEQIGQRISELVVMYQAGDLDENHIPELMDIMMDVRTQSESRLALIALQAMRIRELKAELERLAACEPAHRSRINAVLSGEAT